MTNNITVIQWFSLALILMPILVLWINNHVLSARKTSSQMLLAGTLGFALIAAESSSVLALVLSIALCAAYSFMLIKYYVAAMYCSKRHEQLPTCRRP